MTSQITSCTAIKIDVASISGASATIKAAPNPDRKATGPASRKITVSVAPSASGLAAAPAACKGIVLTMPAPPSTTPMACFACVKCFTALGYNCSSGEPLTIRVADSPATNTTVDVPFSANCTAATIKCKRWG